MLANAILQCATIPFKYFKKLQHCYPECFAFSPYQRFFNCSSVSHKFFNEKLIDKYIARMIKAHTKEATPGLQNHFTEILNDIQDIKEFESYSKESCDNSVTTINYNPFSSNLYIHIQNFNPYYDENKKRNSVAVSRVMMISRGNYFSKEWMIVTKLKANSFKISSASELKYIDQKAVQLEDVIEAMSIAFAPAMLGLCKLPERFVKVITNMCEQHIANPSPGFTVPTGEQRQKVLHTLENFRQFYSKPNPAIQRD